MNIPELIKKINWRLILLHLIATYFVVLAVQQFILLSDMEIVNSVHEYGSDEGMKRLRDEENGSERITYLLVWINLAPLIGLVLSFILSLTVTRMKKAFFINSVLVFLLGFLFLRIGLFESNLLNAPLASILEWIPDYSIQILLKGSVWLLIGLLVFFSKWTNKFAFEYQGNK